ncbi:MAG: transglycosylase [Prolixibacteraceae bacterium]
MKIAGIILFTLGIIGAIVFGIQAANDSETFSIFGLDVAVSEANWTPLIFSVVVMLVGIFLTFAGKRSVRS